MPEDPVMLLSYINMKLRDRYPSFEDLCEDTGADPAVLQEKLASAGYVYDEAQNQFR